MKTTKYAVIAGLALLLIDTGSAYARWTTTFNGTRNQVRTACANVGGEVVEGETHTTCFNDKNGTIVQCGDEGTCSGSGPRVVGDLGLGILGIRNAPKVMELNSMASSSDNDSAPAPVEVPIE